MVNLIGILMYHMTIYGFIHCILFLLNIFLFQLQHYEKRQHF